MSNQLMFVIETTIKNLNEQIGALRSNITAELTGEQAKRLNEKIQSVIKTEINKAFRSASIADTTKLRRQLSLLLHPDKMRTALPDLYEKLDAINTQECTYTLRDYPQQIVNEMTSSNPFAYNFSAPSDDSAFRSQQPYSRQYSSSQAQEKDDPFKILQGWLEAVGHRLAQHHRYPEFMKNAINNFHTILDYILIGAYGIGTYFFILFSSEYFWMLFCSLMLAVGVELGIVYLYTGRTDSIKDESSIFTNISIICNLIAHLFIDSIVDPSWSTISLRILQIVLAPMLLLAEIYIQFARIIGQAVFFVLAVPAVAIKLVATIFFSFPFYLLDGYYYLQKILSTSSNPIPNERGVAEKPSRLGMFGSSSNNHENPRTASNDGIEEDTVIMGVVA